jgi:hypothetical protein
MRQSKIETQYNVILEFHEKFKGVTKYYTSRKLHRSTRNPLRVSRRQQYLLNRYQQNARIQRKIVKYGFILKGHTKLDFKRCFNSLREELNIAAKHIRDHNPEDKKDYFYLINAISKYIGSFRDHYPAPSGCHSMQSLFFSPKRFRDAISIHLSHSMPTFNVTDIASEDTTPSTPQNPQPNKTQKPGGTSVVYIPIETKTEYETKEHETGTLRAKNTNDKPKITRNISCN